MRRDQIQIELWPLDRLLPYAANARTHPDEQVAQIAGSIAEFGFNVPCLVDERGVLVAGHGRLLAAQRLGLSQVPVIRLDHLTDAQARAYRIADNQIALNSGWDDALLSVEVARLKEDGVDLELLGFPEDELDRLLAGLDGEKGGNEDEDVVPEPPVTPISRPGDLWILGRHRLLCGDATRAADVARLLRDVRPHLMVTDPPYGVDYDPSWRNDAGVSATTRTGRVSNDDRADWREAWALFPGDVAYVWHAGVHARTVAESLDASGFPIRSQIIWSKSRFVLGRGDYHWQHEPCFYAVRKGATGHWQGARDQSTVWMIGGGGDEDAATVHGTQKPVECMRRPMINNSERGDAVYEPFAGSGTTLIAAESIERRCFAMEIDPRYCDVIIERWQSFTGAKAKLETDGRSFEDVRTERGP
ncbi:site-specific DNA-methyltransferase [Haematospirillum sp. 15-248]|uniref:site-specific DNA-methyltransferase n=1 Tax=Haematospirillum sp. 15-248 TaxID=2723107 RepID=UPI00143ACD3D|nr:site-specific DNA-methyltransferase [Haematospirillum sp. 15-248]NKD87742.1 site-specific DNA-methyltransferase [Haematospirillum sp. 15-248]